MNATRLLGAAALLVLPLPAQDYAAVFDGHWQSLADEYPYFELYGVDWDAERAEHRPKAIAATSDTEFAWEMARLLSCLRDAHTDYLPSPDVMKGWAIPEVRTVELDRRVYIVDWEEHGFVGPERFADDPLACPEIVHVQGTPLGSGVQVLAAGPPGTTCEVKMRWPDGTETDETIRRPDAPKLPPIHTTFGEDWIVSGRVGSIGYIRVRTFSPKRATLGPSGKMTPVLREHLKELIDTDALILDLQGNGGGVVGASDPFLSHFLKKRRGYRWGGNSKGKRRTLAPRMPRYDAPVVAIVDEKSASGGEWAARILRDAGRATVIGGRTLGAEAAVHTSEGKDGSKVMYSAWPMIEPGVEPFQNKGVTLDHALPLTIEAVREHGFDEAKRRVERERYAKALELLGGPADLVDELVELATVPDPVPKED